MQQIDDDPTEDDPNKENIDPQPMPSRAYARRMSRILSIPERGRDRSILLLQQQKERRWLQWRITLLARFMVHEPFPGPAITDVQNYFGRDYDRQDLEDWLRVLATANWFCDPMTHAEYFVMRTACLTMMRTMISEIPGISYNFPALWYTFDNMGQLLDALRSWPTPLVGQMAVANDFFNNPQWLPINP